MTLFAGSPCAKMVSRAANLPTVLPRPVESRNNFALNAVLSKCAFLGERRPWADTRRTWVDTMRQNNMVRRFAACSILHSTGLARAASFDGRQTLTSTADSLGYR